MAANSDDRCLSFNIGTTWDNTAVSHDPLRICLSCKDDTHLHIQVEGPFFNDPPNPRGEVGQAFDQLWDYEVAEAFFLNDKNQYLEVEFCPHGQHLLLMLSGPRKCFKDKLPVKYSASISGDTWCGHAEIPLDYLPPNVTKFNAYAIHGSGDNRQYEALYPADNGKHKQPDFHRLEYFKPVDLSKVLGDKFPQTASPHWTTE